MDKYVLYGYDACQIYYELDFDLDPLIKAIKIGHISYKVVHYPPNVDIERVMEDVSWWMDYALITKEEYEQLKEL